jgi:hypothetical protein
VKPERESTPKREASKRRSRSAEEERFVEDLLVRGEAAEADPDGELPRGATHEIVEEREGELPRVERRRFSAF